MVNGVVFRQYEVGDSDKFIPLLGEGVEDFRQGLRRGLRPGMEKDYTAVLDVIYDALGHGGGLRFLPVPAVHVPLNGHEALLRGGGNDVVVISAAGCPEKSGPASPRRLDFVAGTGKLVYNFLLPELRHVRVGIAVGGDFMARGGNGLDCAGVFLRPLAEDEKGRLGVVLPENFKQGRNVFRVPGAVEGDGDLFLLRFD